MKSNNFFGLVMFVLALFMLDPLTDCTGPAVNTQGLLSNPPLSSSTDPNVKAAGGANDAAITAGNPTFESLRDYTLAPENINKGKDMDFANVDYLIQADPWGDTYYLQKAAMLIAAGKDDSEVRKLTGQGYDATMSGSWKNPDELYEAHYIIELARVERATTPGSPQRNRTHSELCSQVALYKKMNGDPVQVALGGITIPPC